MFSCFHTLFVLWLGLASHTFLITRTQLYLQLNNRTMFQIISSHRRAGAIAAFERRQMKKRQKRLEKKQMEEEEQSLTRRSCRSEPSQASSNSTKSSRQSRRSSCCDPPTQSMKVSKSRTPRRMSFYERPKASLTRYE